MNYQRQSDSWKQCILYNITNILKAHKKKNWENSCNYFVLSQRLNYYKRSVEKTINTPHLGKWWDRRSKNFTL